MIYNDYKLRILNPKYFLLNLNRYNHLYSVIIKFFLLILKINIIRHIFIIYINL